MSWLKINSISLSSTSNSQWCIPSRRAADLTGSGVFGRPWDLLKHGMHVGPGAFFPAAWDCHHLATAALPRCSTCCGGCWVILFHSPAAAMCSCCHSTWSKCPTAVISWPALPCMWTAASAAVPATPGPSTPHAAAIATCSATAAWTAWYPLLLLFLNCCLGAHRTQTPPHTHIPPAPHRTSSDSIQTYYIQKTRD